jgi:hypothetical protein
LIAPLLAGGAHATVALQPAMGVELIRFGVEGIGEKVLGFGFGV